MIIEVIDAGAEQSGGEVEAPEPGVRRVRGQVRHRGSPSVKLRFVKNLIDSR